MSNDIITIRIQLILLILEFVLQFDLILLLSYSSLYLSGGFFFHRLINSIDRFQQFYQGFLNSSTLLHLFNYIILYPAMVCEGFFIKSFKIGF